MKDSHQWSKRPTNRRSDSEVFAAVKAERRVLVTLDRDFADVRAYPPLGKSGSHGLAAARSACERVRRRRENQRTAAAKLTASGSPTARPGRALYQTPRELCQIPKSGITIPGMGTTSHPPEVGLADALFTPVQQRVLALFFGQPDRRFQSAEVIRIVRSGTGAVHRQLGRLASVGLLNVTQSGNQKFYQANHQSPVFTELRDLVVKTVGMREPIRRALTPLARRIRAAFVYGSVAAGTDKAGSDVDLMVIADTLNHADLFDALQLAEQELARPINPTVLTRARWRAKRNQQGSFAARLSRTHRLMIIGDDDDLD